MILVICYIVKVDCNVCTERTGMVNVEDILSFKVYLQLKALLRKRDENQS